MLNYLCAGRFGLGWAHDIYLLCTTYAHEFSCIRSLHSVYFYIFKLFGAFLIVSFFPSLSFRLHYSCLWHQNVNPFHPRILFVQGHRLPLILLLLISSSMMRMPERTSRRTFLDEVFIRNAESFWRTLPTLTYPMSFTVGVRSHCVTSQSLVLPCWSKSFTPTCMDSILQYLSFILAFEVRTLLSHHSLLQMCFMFQG